MMQVVVVTQDMLPGDKFTRDKLKTEMIQADQVVPNAATSPDQLIGLRAGEVLYQNQQVPFGATNAGVS
jgi:flagella basal body P-ring formation protein FlgA